MKVLVAESGVESRKLLQESLDGWGYQVALAEDPVEIMATFRRQAPPAIVILGTLGDHATTKQVCGEVSEYGCRPYVYILRLALKADSG